MQAVAAVCGLGGRCWSYSSLDWRLACQGGTVGAARLGVEAGTRHQAESGGNSPAGLV